MTGRGTALLATLLFGCGPSATSYEVDLIPDRHCTTRAGVETCNLPGADRLTSTLLIEPRGDTVLMQLGDQLFVATGSELKATRTVESSRADQGCQSRSVHALSVSQGWGTVSGSYTEQEIADGPSGLCGQTPYGESQGFQLAGTEISDP